MPHTQLDTRGLTCPLPVLKAKKAMASLLQGQILEIMATDPGSVADFAVFCKIGGHELLEQSEQAGVYRFTIQRG